MKLLFLAAVILTAIPNAQAMTGNQLLRECQSQTYNFCLGYIDGSTDTQSIIDVARSVTNEKEKNTFYDDILWGPKYCIPDGVTLGQLRLIFLEYATKNPKDLHLTGYRTLQRALGAAYPCR